MNKDFYKNSVTTPFCRVIYKATATTSLFSEVKVESELCRNTERSRRNNRSAKRNKSFGYKVTASKFTMDSYGIDLIDDASVGSGAATAPTNWNCKLGTGQEWQFKKAEILDRFMQGSNNIFEKTLRAMATFCIAGNNVARVLRQLDSFKAVPGLGKNPPTGPMKIGTTEDGLTVVQHPFMQTRGATNGRDRYILGYRGSNFLHAGMGFLPYIPLFSTPTIITSDLYAQKGFLSAAGYKVINAGMFCSGTISNLGTTAVE